MFSRKVISVLSLAVLLTVAGAGRASATSFYFFTDDSTIGGIGVDTDVPGYGIVKLQQHGANTVDVTVSLMSPGEFTDTGKGHVAFAFNLLNEAALTVEDVTPGFEFVSPGGAQVKNSPFGEFNYGFICTACQGGNTVLAGPLTFTLIQDGLTEESFMATTKQGYFFAADIFSTARLGGGQTGAIGVPGSQLASNSYDTGAIPTPEPASLLLFGTGLAVIGRRLRKKKQ